LGLNYGDVWQYLNKSQVNKQNTLFFMLYKKEQKVANTEKRDSAEDYTSKEKRRFAFIFFVLISISLFESYYFFQ